MVYTFVHYLYSSKIDQSETALIKIEHFIITILSILTLGCNSEHLDPLNKAFRGNYYYGSVEANFCVNPPTPGVQKIKYLFILDHSQSNKPGFPLSADDISNTDDQGLRRYGPLVQFINNLVDDSNNLMSFSIIDFNDIAYQPTPLVGFESDKTDFLNIIKADWIGPGLDSNNPSPADGGFTHYVNALNLAFTLIKNDAQAEAVLSQSPIVTSTYQIIFVSDGKPVVISDDVGDLDGIEEQTFNNDINPVILNIMNLKNDSNLGTYISNITLNTAYYYNDTFSSEAMALLAQMAETGNGQFLEFGGGKNILYQQFAPPSRNISNQLVDVFIENSNGIWWEDGRYLLDSDSDGLPDEIEIRFGSYTNFYDSDGNGVSDLVEFRTKGVPCKDASCFAANRDTYSICSGFSPKVDDQGNMSYDSSSNDGLNDCEKFILGGRRDSFSSNGNLIPDLFAFKNGMPIQSGSDNSSYSDPFGDGVNNYFKLKTGFPIKISIKQLGDFEGRSIKLDKLSSSSSDLPCYDLRVDNIALTSDDNSMKVMIVQNSSLLQDKPFLIQAQKKLDGEFKAKFSQEDFR